MRSGSGSRLTDEEGKQYIDYCLAFGPMILGHSHPDVTARLKSQIDLGLSFGTPGKQEVELGELIKDAIPSMEMMRFTNSGTEATMHAIRLARFFTGRNLILKIEGGFHGSHESALTTIKPEQVKDPDEKSTIEIPFNDTATLERVFAMFGRHIAALIMEPVLGNIGVVQPKNGFLQLARKLTEENGALLIFDEVITGFRSRYGGYQDMAGIRPDLTTLGKIIGGGLPVGLFGGREDILRNVSPSGKFYQQGTFSGNPLTMAGGIATMEILRKSDYSIPSGHAERLSEEIRKSFLSTGIPVQVNQTGTMFTVFFNSEEVVDSRSAVKSDTARFTRFFNNLMNRGVFIPKSQFESCFVSFAHTENDIGETTSVIREVAEEMR